MNTVSLTACAISMALRPWAGLEVVAPLPPLAPLDTMEPIGAVEPIGGGEVAIGGGDMDVSVGGGGSPAVSFATSIAPRPS